MSEIVSQKELSCQKLYEKDSYSKECNASITEVREDAIVLNQTIFYPQGGGQPGDIGQVELNNGSILQVLNTTFDQDGAILHHVDNIPEDLSNKPVKASINWDLRYKHMRMHTCLHLLCSLVEADVTGCSIGAEKGRLDFDLQESTLDKQQLSDQLNELISKGGDVLAEWWPSNKLADEPALVRTAKVSPPVHNGQVRLIRVQGVDLQPCGGTHVNNINEIGEVYVRKIEKKSRHNRRVNVYFK